ncbi:MAG: hypothetical protein GTO03_14510 [Planctomycetales bacterium]|nr:hypothetical protein [Planctomycetales bacterium]
MKCHALAHRLEQLRPAAGLDEIARLCLLLAHGGDAQDLGDDDHLDQLARAAEMRLQVATDQHAAVTRELEELARSNPQEFRAEQIWILIRAIKVQSQLLEMCLDQPALDV